MNMCSSDESTSPTDELEIDLEMPFDVYPLRIPMPNFHILPN